jgi:hypothetical protein
MDQPNAVDLSFIPTTLTVINGLLEEADVAEVKGDRATEHTKLMDAGAHARVALRKLHDLPLWDQLRAERQERLRQWKDLGLPVVVRLLEDLGYKRPPPARELIDLGDDALRVAAGFPAAQEADPISQAQDAISDLEKELERLMKSERFHRKLRVGIRKACGALAKGFGAVVLAKTADAGIHYLPQAEALLREWIGDAARLMPSLSMALVAGVVREIRGLDSVADRTSRGDERRTSREDRERVTAHRNQHRPAPQDTSPRANRGKSGPRGER